MHYTEERICMLGLNKLFEHLQRFVVCFTIRRYDIVNCNGGSARTFELPVLILPSFGVGGSTVVILYYYPNVDSGYSPYHIII